MICTVILKSLFLDIDNENSQDVFMYGNYEEIEEKNEEIKLYPYIMSKICPYFSYKSSRYFYTRKQ